MGGGAEWGVAARPRVVLPERYELIRRIATGGMASVWCAHDHTLDRRVAVKLLAERFAHDDLAGRRFKREARAAARLSGHPNVVTIYDVGQAGASELETPERPFLVMEYLAGGTAADALRARAVDVAIATAWLRQAAAALDYAHRRGIIHGDVKLANFLLDRDRVLHVADFGIAQLGAEDTLTTSDEVLGTAAYLAPERALGQPTTEAADRYALAVAAFELLVGERPFAGRTVTEVAHHHLEQPRPQASLRNPALPPALDAVLMHGMAKRPEDRFPTARAFAEAVESTLPVKAPRTTPRIPPAHAVAAASPTRYSVSRGRGRMGALAALVAALAAVTVAAAQVGGGSAPKPRATASAAASKRPKPLRHAGVTSKRTVRKRSSTTATTSTEASPRPPSPPSPPPASPAAPSLEAQAHQLMIGGNYGTAIPLLRDAVATAPPGSLTYAYALFDLGRSLRLAGDPRAAVPVLWRRLQIPNQTGVVRAELTLALEALGRQAGGGSPSAAAGTPAQPSGPGKGPGHHGHAAKAQPANGQPGNGQVGNGPGISQGGSGPGD